MSADSDKSRSFIAYCVKRSKISLKTSLLVWDWMLVRF